MPSGAKKRKAAKKKKELQVKGTHAHGEEDLKQESDEGEVSSPLSQDNQNQLQSVEEEADKPEDNQSGGITSEGEQMEKKVIVEEESVIYVEKEMKASDEPIECIESSRGSRELKSSSSSGSSSDDESDAANKSKIMVANYPTVDLVKELDPLSAAQVTESSPETETCNQDVGTVISIETVQVEMNASDNDNIPSFSIEPELTKDEKIKLSVDDESASVSEVLVDTGSQRKENDAVQTSHDSGAETLHREDSATQENGDKLTQPVDTPKVDVSTGPDPVKDPEVPDYSDTQPLVGSALQPVQRMSWKGCCGLFELFTGSGR